MKRILIVVSIFNVLDLVLTSVLVLRFGIEMEANPFGVWLYQNPIVLIVFKLGIVNFGLYLLYRFRYLFLARLGTIVSLVAYSVIMILHATIYLV